MRKVFTTTEERSFKKGLFRRITSRPKFVTNVCADGGPVNSLEAINDHFDGYSFTRAINPSRSVYHELELIWCKQLNMLGRYILVLRSVLIVQRKPAAAEAVKMSVGWRSCVIGAVDGFILDGARRRTHDPREFCCVIFRKNNSLPF